MGLPTLSGATAQDRSLEHNQNIQDLLTTLPSISSETDDDGSLQATITEAGSFTLQIDHFEYKDTQELDVQLTTDQATVRFDAERSGHTQEYRAEFTDTATGRPTGDISSTGTQIGTEELTLALYQAKRTVTIATQDDPPAFDYTGDNGTLTSATFYCNSNFECMRIADN